MRISLKLAAAALLPLALAACGGGKKSAATPVTPVAQAFQDKFGSAFATDFNASITTEPANPSASDVPALNLSAEPLDN